MNRITFSPLRLEFVGDTNGVPTFRLYEPLTLHFSLNGGGIRVLVPAGFVTDFYSIPGKRLRARADIQLKDVLSYKEPSVLHDYLYRTGKIGDRRIAQKEADALMLEALQRKGLPQQQIAKTYAGVRVGGSPAWWLRRKMEQMGVS